MAGTNKINVRQGDSLPLNKRGTGRKACAFLCVCGESSKSDCGVNFVRFGGFNTF